MLTTFNIIDANYEEFHYYQPKIKKNSENEVRHKSGDSGIRKKSSTVASTQKPSKNVSSSIPATASSVEAK